MRRREEPGKEGEGRNFLGHGWYGREEEVDGQRQMRRRKRLMIKGGKG